MNITVHKNTFIQSRVMRMQMYIMKPKGITALVRVILYVADVTVRSYASVSRHPRLST
jgi:hypothetical protein